MKRSILVVLVFLFTVSASGLAQQTNVAKTVYDKWRQEAPADEVSKLRYALAAVTRRTGDEVAELDLWAVGREPEVVVEVQPLHVETLPSGGFRQEQAGEMTKTNIGSQDSQSVVGDNVGLKLTLPVRSNANALEIKWSGYVGGKLHHAHVIQTWLRGEPTETLTKITAGR
jgi:hypothetical protein